ncbi:S8 family serine peptidase [Ensifer aridi]|uniref:S8 family serine peptidase n=2 Tax=Ensifer aridi TaxID=1708715 RepID=UPI0006882F40|nr:S8 family serine peptidase [Ensifer aridi]
MAAPISPEAGIELLDYVSADGPRLVEMTPEAELALRIEEPDLKIVPVVRYRTMKMQHRILREASASVRTTRSAAANLFVKDTDGNPIPGAQVIAFTNFRTKAGDEGISDDQGRVRLRIAKGTSLDRIYVYGPPTYWGHSARRYELVSNATVALESVDLRRASLALNRFRAGIPVDAGTNVIVGIVDTGIARDHPLLPNVSGGANMVSEETRDDPGRINEWGPAAVDGEHGTHVAGIVGARPTADIPLSGVAPGVTLRSYRVFPHSGEGAINYDIMNAIDRAVQDGCHIINLSLGGGAEDEAVRAAIGSALSRGVIVIAAAGNDGRKPVSFPAALPFCIAVSAMGRRDSFPQVSTEALDIAAPFGANDSFVGAFSNFGPQIDLTGPGVGVVSTLPGATYGPMSGTSMATPAVAGYAAFLLASNNTIFQQIDENRSRALTDALFEAARAVGFGRDYEGFGLPGQG